jgi:hypothetical protein
MLTCAVICISETWFKRWHTNKRFGIPGYKVSRSDRRDGRRSCGVVMYIKDQYKYKILSKSPDSCIIDYIFIELKFHGEDILIELVYNPPGVPGLPVYQPILEDLFPRYSHGNTNLLVNSVHALELKLVLESVSFSIISKEPTNFSSASPTLINICVTSEPDSSVMVSQISLPEMNTDHASTHPETRHFRNYNRIDIEQLVCDTFFGKIFVLIGRFSVPNFFL